MQRPKLYSSGERYERPLVQLLYTRGLPRTPYNVLRLASTRKAGQKFWPCAPEVQQDHPHMTSASEALSVELHL